MILDLVSIKSGSKASKNNSFRLHSDTCTLCIFTCNLGLCVPEMQRKLGKMNMYLCRFLQSEVRKCYIYSSDLISETYFGMIRPPLKSASFPKLDSFRINILHQSHNGISARHTGTHRLETITGYIPSHRHIVFCE